TLFAIAATVFAWAGIVRPYPFPAAELVLEAIGAYVIARVVHAEPLPGDRQFWLTRPYNRLSLVGAKLMFIAALVCGPICLAHIAMLVGGGFSIGPNLAGLVWSQVLIFFAGALPVAALAAVVPGTLVFVLVTMSLAMVLVVGTILFSAPAMAPTPL